MDMAKLYCAGAFLAGLVVTLFLASCLTPCRWWRRPNARALLILVAGTWGIGSLLLHLAPAPRAWAKAAGQDSALAAPALTGKPMSPDADADADAPTGGQPGPAMAGQPFLAHRALHLRAAAGVAAPLLATVPPGATVTPTGARDGDWWQVRATMADASAVGWVSSLWLRRSGE
jgi:hypothetical protein